MTIDPLTGVWTSCPAMSTRRRYCRVAVLGKKLTSMNLLKLRFISKLVQTTAFMLLVALIQAIINRPVRDSILVSVHGTRCPVWDPGTYPMISYIDIVGIRLHHGLERNIIKRTFHPQTQQLWCRCSRWLSLLHWWF